MRRLSWRSDADHVEAAELADLVALGLALALNARRAARRSGPSALLAAVLELLGHLVERHRQRRSRRPAASGVVALLEHLAGGRDPRGCRRAWMSTPRPAMLVATVTRAEPAGLGDDLGLTGVLLGVEHLVRRCRAGRAAATRYSLFSTLTVPTSTGWPVSWRSAMSSTTASNFAVLALVDQVGLVDADAPAGWSGSAPRRARRCSSARRPRSGPCRSCRRACRTCGSSSGA